MISKNKGGKKMALESLDTYGLKCPQPVLRIAAKSREMKNGDILEVLGDCPTFEQDVRNWAQRNKRVVLSVKNNGSNKLVIQIQF
jgi:tRNA 2-thiouridine synthesizing protein A